MSFRFSFPRPIPNPLAQGERGLAASPFCLPLWSPALPSRDLPSQFGDGSLCSLPQRRRSESPSGPIRRRRRLCCALHLRRGDAPPCVAPPLSLPQVADSQRNAIHTGNIEADRRQVGDGSDENWSCWPCGNGAEPCPQHCRERVPHLCLQQDNLQG